MRHFYSCENARQTASWSRWIRLEILRHLLGSILDFQLDVLHAPFTYEVHGESTSSLMPCLVPVSYQSAAWLCVAVMSDEHLCGYSTISRVGTACQTGNSTQHPDKVQGWAGLFANALLIGVLNVVAEISSNIGQVVDLSCNRAESLYIPERLLKESKLIRYTNIPTAHAIITHSISKKILHLNLENLISISPMLRRQAQNWNFTRSLGQSYLFYPSHYSRRRIPTGK